MTIWNITTKKVYPKDGVDKTVWLNVGRLIRFEATDTKQAQMMIELNMYPTTKFYAFPQKEREEKPKPVEEEDDLSVPF